MQERGARSFMEENPFYVLGLSPFCTRAQVEREGQKLLGMLELGLSAARTYVTPLGPLERTPEKVRLAMAELRDPQTRLVHELFAQLPASTPPPPTDQEKPAAPPWPEALWATGWRRA